MSEILRLPDETLLARAAAHLILEAAQETLSQSSVFTIALSGGNTPRLAYTELVEDPRAHRLDWKRIHVFWIDERCVPPDHELSNARMARETFLDSVGIPAENIHRMKGELEPESAAQECEEDLRIFFNLSPEDLPPPFDLVLLGLGEDGHIASLFPHSSTLGETRRWVVAAPEEVLGARRLTLTLPVLNAARHAAFLISGQEKADIVARVLQGPREWSALPAQGIALEAGRLIWLLDETAASRLVRDPEVRHERNGEAHEDDMRL